MLYTFTPKQDIVQIYVRQILEGERERENVPVLYNLQEVVWAELDKLESGEEG
jgi:hypothetical protein